jgi:hypothetical protein
MTNVDTVANMMVNPLQASTLPVWGHKDNFKCMDERKRTVADMKVEPLPVPARKLDNVTPSTLPVWNHKDNFKFL